MSLDTLEARVILEPITKTTGADLYIPIAVRKVFTHVLFDTLFDILLPFWTVLICIDVCAPAGLYLCYMFVYRGFSTHTQCLCYGLWDGGFTIWQPMVGCRWVYPCKQRAYGTIDRLDDYLVVKGCTQTYDMDFIKTSPVSWLYSVSQLIRLLCTLIGLYSSLM